MMTLTKKLIREIVLCIVLISVCGVASAADVEYIHQVDETKPWSIHILKIDRSDKKLDITANLAQGKVQGTQTVRQQATGLDPSLGKAVGAINGDFYFTRGTFAGDPVGLHIRQGELISRSAPDPVTDGATFWMTDDGEPKINRIANQFTVTWPNGSTTSIGLNEMRGRTDSGWDNIQAVLFTPTFGPSTPEAEGREIVLERIPNQPWLPLKPSQTYRARIRSVIDDSKGGTRIPRQGMILSLAPEVRPAVEAGDVIRISMSFRTNLPKAEPLDLSDVPTAMGGYPVVVFDNHNYGQYIGDKARHPRTAVGYNAEHIFFVVVDGRQPDLSIGMNYTELGDLMISLGCTHAINLDGGGSSTLWYREQVKNSPSDKSERRVSQALIVYEAKPDKK